MDLKEWSINYVRNRDLVQRKLQGFEEKEKKVIFDFEDGKQEYVILEELEPEVVKDYPLPTCVVCLNIEENVKFILDNWKELCPLRNLRFIFVNPASNTKWIISPFVHARIADPESLETGIMSMYEAASE